jgi:hypothetical protein
MKITNPISVTMAVLNVGAALWEILHNHDWRMGGIFICYAVASALLGVKL